MTKQPKIVVHTPTRLSFDRLMIAYEKYTDWRWDGGGEKPTEYDGWVGENTCIEIGDDFGLCMRFEVERDGEKVISFEEAIKKLKRMGKVKNCFKVKVEPEPTTGKEHVKFTEIYDGILIGHIEKIYKSSFRKDWWMSSLTFNPKEQTWIAKWNRKYSSSQKP